MKAVILAGAVHPALNAKRNVPRVLWPFPRRSLLDHVISFLVRFGISDVAVCSNTNTDVIAEALGARSTPRIFLQEDPVPRGPAGCLRDLRGWLDEDHFVLIQGTGWYDFDLNAMIAAHRISDAAVTVGAQPSSAGHFLEPAGVYVIEPQMLALVPVAGFCDLKEQLLPKVIAAGKVVRPHVLSGHSVLIHGTAHYLAAIHAAILRASTHAPVDFRECAPWIFVHKTASLHPSSRFLGPVWIDAGAVVEREAVVIGPAIIGVNSRVSAQSIVFRAVLMRNAVLREGEKACSAVVSAKGTQPTPGRLSTSWPVAPYDELNCSFCCS